MTFSQQVQRVRRMLAEGKTPEEIIAELGDTEPGVAETALRRAVTDREWQTYQPAEVAIVLAVYGIIPTPILAAALGRSPGSVKWFVSVRGATHGKLRCPNCGREMSMNGLPFASFSDGRGDVRWSVRCNACGHERLYNLGWIEVGSIGMRAERKDATENLVC